MQYHISKLHIVCSCTPDRLLCDPLPKSTKRRAGADSFIWTMHSLTPGLDRDSLSIFLIHFYLEVEMSQNFIISSRVNLQSFNQEE